MTSESHHACAHDHADHAHDHSHGHDHAHGRHDHSHDHGCDSCDGHDHGFGFGHAHVHAPASFGRAFAIGILLNTVYVIAEALWGVWAHSLSLLADAGHNLSDILGLGAAWLAESLARRAPTTRFTYGLRRSTILAAFVNATVLLLVTGGIIWEAIVRLFVHTPVEGLAVSWVALVGIAVNAVTALLFMKGASNDLNIRGAFLHMASDAMMSFAVVIAGLLIAWTGFQIIDPIVSLIVSASIIMATWSLLKGAVSLSLDGVPSGIVPADVQTALLEVPGVCGLHHLHIWPMSTTETALTVHLLREETAAQTPEQIITQASVILREKFGISHPTFQIESPPASCDLQQACC
ncbi:cobalt transporter [Gluconobacter oxydans]|uniref:cation diffusion facilitator family transporter n=1 Tax=Gluconobacter thailandicus TaxID=257438 RepID=UPI00029962A8|nr:cation diffusion facilitator family transporter [Gluconobacter thailandicus]AFW00024.1 cation efflux system protein [Gluconobacter oxydans H24]ANQ41170.1 cobalt transporter [Gluconobacter oxydans]